MGAGGEGGGRWSLTTTAGVAVASDELLEDEEDLWESADDELDDELEDEVEDDLLLLRRSLQYQTNIILIQLHEWKTGMPYRDRDRSLFRLLLRGERDLECRERYERDLEELRRERSLEGLRRDRSLDLRLERDLDRLCNLDRERDRERDRLEYRRRSLEDDRALWSLDLERFSLDLVVCSREGRAVVTRLVFSLDGVTTTNAFLLDASRLLIGDTIEEEVFAPLAAVSESPSSPNEVMNLIPPSNGDGERDLEADAERRYWP